MPERTLHIAIVSGDTTCASEKEKFCPWVRTRKFGQVFYCGLFDGKELEGDEWLQRLPECIEAEK